MILIHYLLCAHVNMLLPLMMIHNIWLLLLLCTFYYYSVLMIFYKHCLVSSGDTGWTHLCRSHHDRQAEWILRSSCFHYFTLNVKWYYMQAMCLWTYLYYIYHHTLQSHVCIVPMYYIESTMGLHADQTHHNKITGDIKK